MNDQPDSFFPGPDVFTRAWSDFATQMMQAGMAFTPNKTPPEAARDMRNTMLSAWSDYCDQFMRSPEFLNMMKQSLSASVQARSSAACTGTAKASAAITARILPFVM